MNEIAEMLYDALRSGEAADVSKLAGAVLAYEARFPRSTRQQPPAVRKLFTAIKEAAE